MDNDTVTVFANVWPKGHSYAQGGPVDIRLGKTRHPDIVKSWGTAPVVMAIEQPQEDSNFTLILILFQKPGTPREERLAHLTWHRVTPKFKRGVLSCYVKARYANQLRHPMPIGKWLGTVVSAKNFALYTIQHETLQKKVQTEEKRTIVVPGDPDFLPPH